MVVTLKDLKEKIGRIEQELADVRRGLEQLMAVPEPRVKRGWPAGIQIVDKTGWIAWFDVWFQQIGIPAQRMGAEKLQEMMLQEGIRPEENLLSRGIIAMREE